MSTPSNNTYSISSFNLNLFASQETPANLQRDLQHAWRDKSGRATHNAVGALQRRDAGRCLAALEEGRPVPEQPGVLATPSRPHPVEKLLSRKTLRESQGKPEPARETALPQKKQPSRRARGRPQDGDSAKGKGSLKVKSTWDSLIQKLDPQDGETAGILLSELKIIASASGKKIDTGFITAMCSLGKTMHRYLERFRNDKENEVALLKEMTELGLHKSASSVHHAKGFVTREAVEDLKHLYNKFGKTALRSITGMWHAKGMPGRSVINALKGMSGPFNHLKYERLIRGQEDLIMSDESPKGMRKNLETLPAGEPGLSSARLAIPPSSAHLQTGSGEPPAEQPEWEGVQELSHEDMALLKEWQREIGTEERHEGEAVDWSFSWSS